MTSPKDGDKFATKKDVERVLEVIAACAKKHERFERIIALQREALFESLSPEGRIRVRSAWNAAANCPRTPSPSV